MHFIINICKYCKNIGSQTFKKGRAVGKTILKKKKMECYKSQELDIINFGILLEKEKRPPRGLYGF